MQNPLDIWNMGNGQYWILDSTTDEWYFIVRIGRDWGWFSNDDCAIGRDGLGTLKATKDNLAAYIARYKHGVALIPLAA